jgi:hypothetical protein
MLDVPEIGSLQIATIYAVGYNNAGNIPAVTPLWLTSYLLPH